VIKIGKNAEIDYGAMTVDELMEEVADVVAKNDASKEEFLWQLYGLLEPGTCFQALHYISEFEKLAHHLSVVEMAIHKAAPGVDVRMFPGDAPHWIELCPAIEKGECVMFLGLSDEVFEYKTVEQRYRIVNGRRMPNNVFITRNRKCPKWIIGEKVVYWPLDVTQFKMLALGSRPRKIDSTVD